MGGDVPESKDNNKRKILLTFTIILIIMLVTVVYVKLTEVKIKINGEETVTVDVLSEYQDLGAELTNADGNELVVKSNVDVSKIGEYTVEYTAVVNGRELKETRKVIVVDQKKPEIEILTKKEDQAEVTICPNGSVEDIEFKTVDEYDGDLTTETKVSEAGKKAVFEVEDKSGNSIIEKIPFKKIDEQAPTVSLKGSEIQTVAVGSTYEEMGIDVKDNCSKDLKEKVQVTGSVDANTIGNYEIVYTVADEAGNENTIKRTVEVIQPDPNHKVIYLTFDDGPREFTGEYLEMMKRQNVLATFFVICTDSRFDNLIKEAYDAGHSIGLHTCSHKYSEIYASEDAFFADLQKIDDKVFNITGERSKITRFPGGSSNMVSANHSKGIMTKLVDQVEAKGYTYFDWNIDSFDASGNQSVPVNVTMMENLSEDNPNIILLHDTKPNVADVEQFIKDAKSQGYTFLPLTENSPAYHHTVNN